MIHELTNEAFREFINLRLFSIARMNAFALIKNRNKSLTSLNKDYTLSFPLGITEDLPVDVAQDIANSTKLDLAMKVKALIEANTFDSAQDASITNVLAYLPVKRDGANAALSIPDIVANTSAAQYINEAIMYANKLGVREEEVILEDSNKAIVSNDKGHPLYVNVEIPYITANDEIKYVKNTIGIEVVIKRIKSVDLATVIRENDPKKMVKSYLKATSKEGCFLKDFILELNHIKKTAEVNANQASLLSYIQKEKIRMDVGSGYVYPFVFFAITDEFVSVCKEQIKVDLTNTTDLKQVMKGLLALGIFVYHTNDQITSFYDGDTSTSTVMMQDFTTDVSKYEKDIQQMIRLSK